MVFGLLRKNCVTTKNFCQTILLAEILHTSNGRSIQELWANGPKSFQNWTLMVAPKPSLYKIDFPMSFSFPFAGDSVWQESEEDAGLKAQTTRVKKAWRRYLTEFFQCIFSLADI